MRGERMSFTPVEIRHVKLKRGLGGYHRSTVDHLLEDIADSFELVWRERADLADKVEHLDVELAHHKGLERLLRSTMTTAENAAQEVKEKAHREAELILGEARTEARAITNRASMERERLTAEIRRIRSLLSSALDAVDDAEASDGPERVEPIAEREEPMEAPIDFPSRG
jgi:cell division initiation protein